MPRDPSSDSINYLLAQICRLHHARSRTLLEEIGLYRGQPPVLRALWEKEGLTHSELAEHMHVRPATITKMIKRMEKTGFVTCKADEKDQRVSRVYLTEAGREIQKEVHQIWRTLQDETFDRFTMEERIVLRRLFLQMRENLLRATGGKLYR
jgi:MarR family transcriptional regulator, organic hydroperoxide resistance regulator